MPPSMEKNLPDWVGEKERERFGNFVSILPNRINFSSGQWASWVKLP